MREVTRAIIVNEEGKVLLGKRAYGNGAGKYALVGGKPDQGEMMDQAIIREVKEEIGVNFNPQECFTILDHDTDPRGTWLVFYFTGPYEGDPKLNDEITDFIFVGEEDLPPIDIAFENRDRLIEFFAKKHN